MTIQQLIEVALAEDIGPGDVTSRLTVPRGRLARARLVARANGALAGIDICRQVFITVDRSIRFVPELKDGARFRKGQVLALVSGRARPILSAERTALNFIQRLSGIASATRQFVDAVRGTRAVILDTRKTTPGWRVLEKYAVRAGGGVNHRADLASAILIKDNHLAAVDGDVSVAVRRARELAPPGTKVEVECDRREQVQAALDAGADIIM